MLVGDLIYNDEVDCNCNCEVYDCSKNGKSWSDGAELLFSTKRDGFQKPFDRLLDMKIKYITINNHVLIIEATR